MPLKLTKEEFISRAKKIHGDKFDYSKVKYLGNQTKVCIICPIHGEFWQVPANHMRGKGCYKCRNSNMLSSTLDFVLKSIKVHGNKYNYLKVQYKDAKTKVLITCNIHGDFELRPDSHLSGCGCPKCSESKGETIVRNYLEDKGLNYVELYPINIDFTIRKSGQAYLDFYIPELKIAIEYNGELHYKFIPYFHKGGKIDLERLQLRDKFIRNYCKDNGIKLIEINCFNDITSLLNTISL